MQLKLKVSKRMEICFEEDAKFSRGEMAEGVIEAEKIIEGVTGSGPPKSLYDKL